MKTDNYPSIRTTYTSLIQNATKDSDHILPTKVNIQALT